MGKSAGKWIKTVLFGKKHSKSNYSKHLTPDKTTAVEDPSRDSSFIPDQLAERGLESLELEKGTSGSQCDAAGVAYVDQGIDSPNNDDFVPVPVSDDERRRQEQAATTAQAAFRGYLARRAFRALKGIIRLQALIRGHLVRRQAVATLCCMRAIVKIQALARRKRVRLSGAVPEVTKLNVGDRQVVIAAHSVLFLGSEKLFIRKLLVTLPTAMPLSLQYDLAEPNSASNWLERWSTSRFWELPVRTKKTLKAKPQRKIEPEPTKSKRTIRKAATPLHGENFGIASSETDKPKRIPRKVTSQTEMVQEQHQSELERVKRSLRKVSASAVATPEKPDPEMEKPQPPQNVEIATSPTPADVPEQVMAIPSENAHLSDVVLDKPDSADSVEAPEKTIKDEPVDVQDDNYPVVETPPPMEENCVKMESAVPLEDESSCKEEQSRKENQKIRKRRSLPAKPDIPENNISQNSPSLPSYMAATESAKAKLRAQESAKVAEDVVVDYGNARRHSLPASVNGKLSSSSPRIQKPVQANGKGSSKVSKAVASSKEEKGVQPGWRR